MAWRGCLHPADAFCYVCELQLVASSCSNSASPRIGERRRSTPTILAKIQCHSFIYSFIHAFISNIYITPHQENYWVAHPNPARLRIAFLRWEKNFGNKVLGNDEGPQSLAEQQQLTLFTKWYDDYLACQRQKYRLLIKSIYNLKFNGSKCYLQSDTANLHFLRQSYVNDTCDSSVFLYFALPQG